MRDHTYHGVTILAGMWGIKLHHRTIHDKFASSFWQLVQDPLVTSKLDAHGADQVLLDKYVW